jgi:hypothetical protein
LLLLLMVVMIAIMSGGSCNDMSIVPDGDCTCRIARALGLKCRALLDEQMRRFGKDFFREHAQLFGIEGQVG